jgi:hypothetical protein
MKTLSYVLMMATAVSIAFSSCKKSATPAPAPADVATSMKLTSNGTPLSFNECEQYTAVTNGVTQALFIANNVTNGKVSDEQFEVDIMDDPSTFKVGQTYPMATSFMQQGGAALFYNTNATDSFNTQPAAPTGSVTITETTATTISGTFSGTLYAGNDFSAIQPLYTITNGSFTAKINK